MSTLLWEIDPDDKKVTLFSINASKADLLRTGSHPSTSQAPSNTPPRFRHTHI
jgi:hypothetical protein